MRIVSTTWKTRKNKRSSLKTISVRMIAQLSLCLFCCLFHVLQNARRFRNQQSEGWSCQLAGFNIFLNDFLSCRSFKKGFSYCLQILEKSRPGECLSGLHSFSFYMFLYYFQVSCLNFPFDPTAVKPSLVCQLKSSHCPWSLDSDDCTIFTISLSFPFGLSEKSFHLLFHSFKIFPSLSFERFYAM